MPRAGSVSRVPGLATVVDGHVEGRPVVHAVGSVTVLEVGDRSRVQSSSPSVARTSTSTCWGPVRSIRTGRVAHELLPQVVTVIRSRPAQAAATLG